MATALRRTVALVLVFGVGLLAWNWRSINAMADLDASYGARMACSCRYVSGRSLSDCRNDLEQRLGLTLLREDDEERSVTAYVPLLSSQTASFSEGNGCMLEPWDS